MQHIILHIDLDYFYAQVEEVLNPKLKGRPVVVGADPKGGHGRGVVSTSNYEARKFGVKSGMPISIAYRKCPDCVFLPVNMDLYVEVSARIMRLFKRHADKPLEARRRQPTTGIWQSSTNPELHNKFQLGGIDECYLDVSERCKNYKDAENLARKIKNELKEKEKLTCSVGIGPNKLIAKIAAGQQKPNGITIVKPDDVKAFLKKLSVRELLGVGPKTQAVLNEMNIFTVGQLAKVPEVKLVSLFGRFGRSLFLGARGIDESPVEESGEVKSIGRQTTFERDTKDKKLIFERLDEMIKEVFADLKSLNLKYRTITIKIRYEDFHTTSKAKTLKVASSDEKTARETARGLIGQFLLDERKVRLVGFSVSGLAA